MSDINISLLVAYSKNRVIGKDGKIPWFIPSERDRFKSICKDKFVLMGRKTFEEIGKPLSYCTIIVISKSLKSVPKGCLLADSLEKGIEICKLNSKKSDESLEILIAGGQSIYEQALPLANKIYATKILKRFKGNTVFPKLTKNWKCIEKNIHKDFYNNKKIKYEYLTFIHIT